MAACDEDLNDYVTTLGRRCPNLLPIMLQRYADMLHLPSPFSQRNMKYLAECRAGEPEGCCLLAELTQYNEFLFLINMELREINPGRLALCWLQSHAIPAPSSVHTKHGWVLLHLLLAKHRCIEYVEVWNPKMVYIQWIFLDGLHLKQGLKHAKICHYVQDDRMLRYLMDAVGSAAPALDTLELVGVRLSSASVRTLCCLLRRCEVLRTIVLLQTGSMSQADLGDLAKALASHRKVKKVHVNEPFVLADSSQSLGYIVSHNANVKELIITRSLPCGQDAENSFRHLFRALSNHSTQVERLKICKFALDMFDLNDLAVALNVNERLRDVELLCSDTRPGAYFSREEVKMHDVGNANNYTYGCRFSESNLSWLARALKRNATLQNFVVDVAHLTAEKAVVLLEALSVNVTLRKLDLGTVYQPGLVRFMKELGSRNLRGRLDFKAFYATPADLIDTLKNMCNPCSIHFEPSAMTMPELQNLSSRLSGDTFLSSLTVRLLHKIDENLAVLLSTVFESCRSLRQAFLDFPAETDQSTGILRGIGKSRGLCELTICGWAFNHAEAVAFGDMLGTIRSLNEVTLEGLVWNSGPFLVAQISRGLASNYTLTQLTVKLNERHRDTRHTFQMKECLRRNQSLLLRASRFVVPPASNAKDDAAAFEKVHKSRAFLAEVSRLAGMTEAEAADLVAPRRKFLDDNFLAIAGVVKNKVECHRREAGDYRLQIDDLGIDIWLKIRSFIKLDDILDSVEGAATTLRENET